MTLERRICPILTILVPSDRHCTITITNLSQTLPVEEWPGAAGASQFVAGIEVRGPRPVSPRDGGRRRVHLDHGLVLVTDLFHVK